MLAWDPRNPRDPREVRFEGAGQWLLVGRRACSSTSLARSARRSSQRGAGTGAPGYQQQLASALESELSGIPGIPGVVGGLARPHIWSGSPLNLQEFASYRKQVPHTFPHLPPGEGCFWRIPASYFFCYGHPLGGYKMQSKIERSKNHVFSVILNEQRVAVGNEEIPRVQGGLGRCSINNIPSEVIKSGNYFAFAIPYNLKTCRKIG